MAMLVSREIREERERLAADPIVLAMANEVRGAKNPPDLDDWAVIRMARREYLDRGGKETLTIGSVAAAIKLVLDKEA